MENWNAEKSEKLYGVDRWGQGYFSLSPAGECLVRPDPEGRSYSLPQIVQSLVERGISVPVLLRFDGILRDRVRRVNQAFRSAMQEFGFKGQYRGAYPIKVNQQRHVVDTIRSAGEPFGLGLEVGSKPELVAAIALQDSPEALLLCNGYKDREYLELAMLARKLRRRSIIIIEQSSELDHALQIAEQLKIEPELGIRIKPTARASGRWEASGGEKAKFGLTAPQVVEVIEKLRQAGREHWLKLLHMHVGSQVTSISSIKDVLREATRMYSEVARFCPELCFFDAGGGLAVDYDGSNTNFPASMNYSVEEYARDIVYAVQQACETAGISTPDIITESGRALVAHHALLVVQVLAESRTYESVEHVQSPPSDNEKLRELFELHETLTLKNCREVLHDAISLREDLMQQFNSAEINLIERAYTDNTFWLLLAKLRKISSSLRSPPEELEKLNEELRDTYFCNFSVFQSVPDSWAIDQLFPIMPIDRLNEEPLRRGVLADMTCDSDGKIDHFIDLKDVNNYLNLHLLEGRTRPYYLGLFLVGAYQETLGDLHNLFGDTNAVHIDFSPEGELQITHLVEGDTVREVLSYVQYDAGALTERLRLATERELKSGSFSYEEAARLMKRYREALEGYTYLYVDK